MTYSILNKPTTTIEQMEKWALSKGAVEFSKLAKPCFEASLITGVDPAVSYALSALETGWCYKNNHSQAGIDATYHNPAGLKVARGGSDYDRNAHKRFKDWKEGYLAQQQHLCLYAGQKGYPLKNAVDPRHFPYLMGKAKTVVALGGQGKWNNNPDYGKNVEKLIDDLLATKYEKKIETKKQLDKMIVYNADADVFSAVILSQKLGCPLVKKSDYDKLHLSVTEIIKVGGNPNEKNRFETFKNVAKIL